MAGRFSVPNHRLHKIFGGLLRLQGPLTYLSAPLTTGHKQDMEQGWMPCWTDHFLHRATPLPDPMLQGQAEHFCLWIYMQESGPSLWQSMDSLYSSCKLLLAVRAPLSMSSVLFYLAAHLRLNISRSFKLLYFLKERQVETVTRADKALDFDLNIYLLRLKLSNSPGCAEEDK